MKKLELKFRNRIYLEKQENKYLAPYAVKSSQANSTRLIHEEEHPYRTAIQRDRDRIIHSRAFRRLKHKRQVFLISDGDHFRTRLTHTLEVSQLSRTIAKTLGLNEELVEAIALGHDLGHTPFGHAGEVVLNKILKGQDTLDGTLSPRNFGGFKHNYQSLRVVDIIEKKYKFEGLNLTAYVREGILKHTKLNRKDIFYPNFLREGIHYEVTSPTTLEGQVVAVCDEIAQRTHDLEDGIRAGYVELERVRKLDIIKLVEEKFSIYPLLAKDRYNYRNALINGLINVLVSDVIHTTLEKIEDFYHRKKQLHYFDEQILLFSDKINPLQHILNEFITEEIIFKNKGKEANNKSINIIRQLYKIYLKNPHYLPQYILKRFNNKNSNQTQDKNFIRIVGDHIAGMTDRFAEQELIRLKKQ